MGTQATRVSRALDRYPDGVCQVDFLLPNVIDGGLPITRLAARVKDLRDAGEAIEVVGERYGCVLYARTRVQPEPVVPAAEPVAQEEPQAQLFEPTPRVAIFDEEAA